MNNMVCFFYCLPAASYSYSLLSCVQKLLLFKSDLYKMSDIFYTQDHQIVKWNTAFKGLLTPGLSYVNTFIPKFCEYLEMLVVKIHNA